MKEVKGTVLEYQGSEDPQIFVPEKQAEGCKTQEKEERLEQGRDREPQVHPPSAEAVPEGQGNPADQGEG